MQIKRLAWHVAQSSKHSMNLSHPDHSSWPFHPECQLHEARDQLCLLATVSPVPRPEAGTEWVLTESLFNEYVGKGPEGLGRGRNILVALGLSLQVLLPPP